MKNMAKYVLAILVTSALFLGTGYLVLLGAGHAIYGQGIVRFLMPAAFFIIVLAFLFRAFRSEPSSLAGFLTTPFVLYGLYVGYQAIQAKLVAYREAEAAELDYSRRPLAKPYPRGGALYAGWHVTGTNNFDLGMLVDGRYSRFFFEMREADFGRPVGTEPIPSLPSPEIAELLSLHPVIGAVEITFATGDICQPPHPDRISVQSSAKFGRPDGCFVHRRGKFRYGDLPDGIIVSERARLHRPHGPSKFGVAYRKSGATVEEIARWESGVYPTLRKPAPGPSFTLQDMAHDMIE